MKVLVPNSSQGGGDDERHAWPPGFRFHPTDEELVLYYLKRKICRKRLKLDIIAETDVYKWDPEELPGQSKIRSGDRQWFFFSHRDRKYPNAARSNRATQHGYWKATGKDRNIVCNSRAVGVKKTLVFYIGRAPSGERTDWVMHEYTLDEEELKRCQTAGDYYALYKVYKKSGPGPKNGEQYGAPFKEEDWADDEFGDMNFIVHQENPAIHCKPIVSGTPILAVPQVNNEVPLVVLPTEEANFNERSIVLHQYGMEASFDFTKSASPTSQFIETREMTSAPDINEQDFGINEEDFLELDDLLSQEPTGVNVQTSMGNLQVDELDGFSEFLLGQEPTGVNVQTSTGNVQVDELDGFSEFDLPNMFFYDTGHIGQGMVSDTYLNNFENPMMNQINYQLPFNVDDGDQINSEIWMHDITHKVLTQSESNPQVVSSPNPGVVYENNATNIPTETYLLQSGTENDNDQNWFTSALWAFVESIPTAPASASENALVNRAFERMSSFSRVNASATRTNITSATRTNITSATSTNITAKKASKNRLFFLCSIVVVLFAILWVLKGKNGFVLGRHISS